MENSVEKFWKNVRKKSDADCWNWMGSVKTNGYGQIYWNGFSARAHRISWELHYGKIPANKFVLHRCDNRLCVNPNHLFLGTKAENSADMVSKGRQARKITPSQREEMRSLRSSGMSYSELAIRYSVSESTVRHTTVGLYYGRWDKNKVTA